MIPQIKKILYATDLSKNSSYTFLYAIEIAKRFDAMIVILHVIEPIPSYIYGEGSIEAESVLREAKREEKNRDVEYLKVYLQKFCKKVEAQIGPPCGELITKILVTIGHPTEEILNVSGSEGCDAIVLGTHGKGFLKQTFLGTVAGAVLERTKKPIFIIPLPSETTTIDWDKI